MSLAEFGFVSLTPGHTSARHDWKDANTPRTTKAKSKYARILAKIKDSDSDNHKATKLI